MTNPPVPVSSAVVNLGVLFRGFADPTRLRIMNILAAGGLCVGDMVEILGLPQPTVSRHLGSLRRAGLVAATREWNLAHYRLADAVHPVHRSLLECVRTCFNGIGSLDRERAHATERARQRTDEACLPPQ